MVKVVLKVHVVVVADTISDPMSCDTLAAEDTASLHDAQADTQQPAPQKQPQMPDGPQRPLRLDIIPPPPNTNSTRKSPMVREMRCVELGHVTIYVSWPLLDMAAVVKVSVLCMLG